MLKAVVPVDGGAATAQPLLGVPSRCPSGDGAGVVQLRIGGAESHAEIHIADAVVRGRRRSRGRSTNSSGTCRYVDKVDGHTGEHAEVLAEVPAHRGIELK